jgi:hypothetical protein
MREAKKGINMYANRRSAMHQTSIKSEKERRGMKLRKKRGQEEVARKREKRIERKIEIVTTGLDSRIGHVDNTRKTPL